jgi:hypothetical protein
MRFFTPDLYCGYNSNDDDELNRATERWDEAIDSYQKLLKQQRAWHSPAVRELTRINFHDADVVSITRETKPAPILIVALIEGTTLVTLIYLLRSSVEQTAAKRHRPYSSSHRQWLYDEVHAQARREYEHRFFLSDGSTWKVPFQSVAINRARLHIPARRRKALASAS